ncbi:sugar-binding protein [Tuwongella immobilis]|uniref:Periplasmic binding protein domain-containing protein n=1 Tax=Tuwongella immobilis TaxID=692036 RepID=A0A6C2YMF6_9BACT|nr:sugar-binding protein [Tuwongella immobilis]VIP02778.1 Ribose ABC transporter periplasmic-binding protein OS=Planctomyces limnophilus (strain ATCC 43296 / DSM 3776 / IFAM 1008 / 290) GN=Plim_0778 PE=4 SV=1: Peripla_BP_4 [Tuwongella immobilis]VTS02423.1 Ribose ABC transporter periplasmic-binding protein OS=Planctomyces limnophilus (strain ATCC 43296 / DSM 3776 / IFAM 1008 / 290) GN=Plim_0778 PE=4 SV=1: Peripla_BP_4 [Tuwongella immobilis]
MRSGFLTVAAVLALLLPACSDGKATKVAIVTNNPADFWNIVEAGARKAEAEMSVGVEFRRPANGTAAEQKQIVEALLAQGMNGIAISVLDPENQTTFLNEIAGQTNLITQDNDAPLSKRLAYIGTDNYLAGKAVGRLVKEAMPEGGTIAVFVGVMTSLNAQQRFQGVVDELAGQKDAKGPTYGKYTLYGDVRTDGTELKVAKDVAATVLGELEPKINAGEKVCMIGLYAYNPPAILTAARERNLVGKFKIVGFDEDSETLRGIDKGEIHGTVVQDPFGFGYESVKMLVQLAKGDKSGLPADGLKAVPHRIVTKAGGKDPVTGETRLVAVDYAKELETLMKKK